MIWNTKYPRLLSATFHLPYTDVRYSLLCTYGYVSLSHILWLRVPVCAGMMWNAGRNEVCSRTPSPQPHSSACCTWFLICVNLLFIMSRGFTPSVLSGAKCLFPRQSISQIAVNIITLFRSVRNVSKMGNESSVSSREKTLSSFLHT